MHAIPTAALRRSRSLLALFLAAFALTGLLAPPAAAQQRIPVLVLTGENDTDWRWTSTWMRQVLEDCGKFDVEIALYPNGALADDAWLERFQVIVVDYEGARWGEPAESNFLERVQGGAGVVAVGNAARAFPEWDAYREVVGCAWDDAGGADPFGPVSIRGREQHDLTAGFGDWSNHQDTLLLGVRPKESHRVLGVVDRADPFTGETAEVPVVLLGEYGAGRVVTSTLGHVDWGDRRTWASQTDPQYQQFLIRACEWAATGKTSSISRMEPNTLTAADRAAGWELLFDGESMQSWSEYEGQGLPADRWSAEGGVLVVQPMEGGQVLAPRTYDEFELELEWRVAEGAAAGLHLVTDATGGGVGMDLGGAQGGAAQGLRILRPAGEFNLARIVATRNGVEQWLNGVKLATHRMSPDEWARRMTGDRPKQDAELAQSSPLLQIVLKNEGTAVWFRNIKIRSLEPDVGGGRVEPERDPRVELFNGVDLEGWTWEPFTPSRAPGAFRVQDGLLVNDGLPAGFLRTDATYAEFELELDFRMNPVTKQTGAAALMLRIQPRDPERRDDMFWPSCLDVRVGTNEAGDLHAVREFPMQADARRFNGLLARRIRDTEHRPGDWNHLIARLENGELVVRLNGEVVNTATQVGGAPGSIGLRAENCEVQYRGLTLVPLGAGGR